MVHSGPEATARLLVAGGTGDLHEIDASAVLSAVRRTQVLEKGKNFGRFRWYLEETRLGDDHAVFFNGLALIAFRRLYRDTLKQAGRDMLDDLLRDLQVYAERRARDRGFYYPNEYLGYLVCAWLPLELLGRKEDCERLEPLARDAADYWRKHHWGWGEHLSDIYADIMLDQLAIFLSISSRLPHDLRETYGDLFAELLRIDDLFEGGPRVPAVRSYAFMNVPSGRDYRGWIQPVPEDATLEPSPAAGSRLLVCHVPLVTASGRTWKPLGHVLHELKWHEAMPAMLPRKTDIEIRCANGIKATARIDADVRMGSLSRFPIMPSAEHSSWGLSWQCFPAALWTRHGLWGFFQWETIEAGRKRCHPAEDKRESGALGNALTLAVRPPIAGLVHALQRGGRMAVLRIMPAIPAAWEKLCDRFRLVGKTDKIESRQTADISWELLLPIPGRTVRIWCFSFSGIAPSHVKKSGIVEDWEIHVEGENLRSRSRLVTLWCISAEDSSAPVIEPDKDASCLPRSRDERAWLLRWPGRDWEVRIDPLAGNPLRERGGG